MPEEPFPPAGPSAQEPPGPAPLPGPGNGPQDHVPGGPEDGWDGPAPGGPEQGLFVCLPAQAMELSRFGGDDRTPPMAPGPLLAGVADAVAGGDGTGLAGVSEDFLFAVISGGRRLASWATWLEFSAMRELALRHPAVPARPHGTRPAAPPPPPAGEQPRASEPPGAGPGPGPAGGAPAGHGAGAPASGSASAPGPAPGTGPGTGPAPAPADEGRVRFGEFVADEVSLELRMSWRAAADRISYACDLAGRLPVTFAALGAGLIDPVHAKIIAEQTDIL
ncbi:MAG: DUF222 domain-containing protein, partial [Streptosporangiaceae bacterium]